ncbi:MAG: restriction endonuclease, SacI family [Verrucomicrobia bacterium]|nr:MAG: restriction endonuclease, SacI family [Verrucomicrobiota bacterium]
MENCSHFLEKSFKRVSSRLGRSFISDPKIAECIASVVNCPSNRAGARLLLSCMLAKVHRPEVDPRKPYTKIGSKDCFSGRTYDERFAGDFITRHSLPCNSTTAFLTPTLRNMDQTLTTKVVLVGRPAAMYKRALLILDDVHARRIRARDVLDESIRLLLIERDVRKARLKTLLSGVGRVADALPLSSEDTVNLIAQHLGCKGASRLPVLIVAAAYEAAKEKLGERVLNLTAHNAADEQTGALGDVEITIMGDDKVVTSYEMKNKTVTNGDIDRALQKIASSGHTIQNYLFITTEAVGEEVREYAASKYDETGGVEIAVLDCIGFLRHFLHLFHRLRKEFLDHYQALVLHEADSAVSQALKEAFLALRQAAEMTD